MAEGVRCVTRISLVVAAFFAVAPAPAQPSSRRPLPSASRHRSGAPNASSRPSAARGARCWSRPTVHQPPILHALVAAHGRGVDVRSSWTNERDRALLGLNFVADAGIRVWIDDQTAIAHSKVIVIDRALVVTGSFNFTRTAKSATWRYAVVSSPAVAARFVANWQSRLAVSTAWE